MSVLTGPRITHYLSEGEIDISPFHRDQLNPASYDLRLGDRVAVYESVVLCASDPAVDGSRLRPISMAALEDGDALHALEENGTREWAMTPEFGWVLWPGVLYLMHTVERVCARRHAVVIDGKSSFGRLGVSCHQTAGYGDNGQYTLEVTSVHPVRVFPGMRFCQARFLALEGEVVPYAGRYQGARGPRASKSWQQAIEDDEQGKGG